MLTVNTGECEGVSGGMHAPTRSAMKPQDRRPTPEPVLAMAMRLEERHARYLVKARLCR
jgi:hypothetical protein